MLERFPKSHEQKPPSRPEIIRYNDNTLNLFYGKDGDEVSFERNKYANVQQGSYGRMILTTDSGNHYVFGNGLMINVNNNTVLRLSKDSENLPDVTVGESWRVGAMATTPVSNVQLKYKQIVDGSYDSEDCRVEKPNPFTVAEKLIYAASKQLGLV